VRIGLFVLFPILGYYGATYVFDHKMEASLSRVMREHDDWYPEYNMPREPHDKLSCGVIPKFGNFADGAEVTLAPVGCKGIAPKAKLFALGDSHAMHYAPIYWQLAAEKGVETHVYSFAGCSYIDFKRPMNMGSPGCAEFNNAAMTTILESASEGDIIFLSSMRLDRYGDQWGRLPIENMHEYMYNPYALNLRREALQDAPRWIKPFLEKGLRIVFAAPTPVFKSPPFRCADWFNRANPVCVVPNEQSRQELDSLRKPILDEMNLLSDSFTGIKVWDPFPVLCPGDVCKTSIEGKPLFFDGDHLSAYANFLLYPTFISTVIDN
jgi:SGNH domain (fused to AT3 domains)